MQLPHDDRNGKDESGAKEQKKGDLELLELSDSTSTPNNIVGNTSDLHRELKSRHVTMIALGGALGTGLLIGT
jgi:amino acid permease